MPRLRGGILMLFLSGILYWVGISMLRPMVVLYFEDAGYSGLAIGLMMAAYSAIPLMFAMPIGSLIDRISARSAVLIGAVVTSLSGLLYVQGGAANWVWAVLFAQLLNGIGGLLCWSALQAAAVSACDDPSLPRREHFLPNFTFMNSIAQFAGPILGGVLADRGSFQSVFVSFIAISLLSVIGAWFVPKRHAASEASVSKSSFQFWRSYAGGVTLMRNNRPFMIAIMFNSILFVLVDIKSIFLPLYLSGMDLSNTQIGMILSVYGIAAVLIRPFVGYLLRVMDYQWIIMISILVGGICLTALGFQPAVWIIFALVFAWGLCTGVNQPIALILVAQSVSTERQGMGMTLRTMSNKLVQVVNPVVFGGLTSAVGLTYGFGVVGIALIGLSAAMYRYMKLGIRLEKSADGTVTDARGRLYINRLYFWRPK